MWALAVSALVSVYDVSWYDRAWELVDTDGMPFIAMVSQGECEGDLAAGHATIRIGVVDYFTMSGAEIDVTETSPTPPSNRSARCRDADAVLWSTSASVPCPRSR